MRRASKADKEQLVNILSSAFDTNPSVNWVIPKGAKRLQRLRSLMNYAVDVTLRKHEAYILDEAPTVALCHFSHKPFSFADLFSNIKFVINVTGLKGAVKMAKRESIIKKQHPSSPFMYLWMLGVSLPHQGKGAGSGMLKELLARCDREGLPVYLETSVEKNLSLYQRHGFHIYHELKLDDLHIRFMKREPVKDRK